MSKTSVKILPGKNTFVNRGGKTVINTTGLASEKIEKYILLESLRKKAATFLKSLEAEKTGFFKILEDLYKYDPNKILSEKESYSKEIRKMNIFLEDISQKTKVFK